MELSDAVLEAVKQKNSKITNDKSSVSACVTIETKATSTTNKYNDNFYA